MLKCWRDSNPDNDRGFGGLKQLLRRVEDMLGNPTDDVNLVQHIELHEYSTQRFAERRSSPALEPSCHKSMPQPITQIKSTHQLVKTKRKLPSSQSSP